MSFRTKRRELHGVVGGVGVVIMLIGFVGGYLTWQATVVAAFAVWIIGATVVNLLTDPFNKHE